MPEDIKRNGNFCTDAEYKRMNNAMEHTLGVVNKSMANYDETKFRKWFGENNAKQTDWMVKARIKNSYEFMKNKYINTWNIVCCHNTLGSCDNCTGSTLAYVLAYEAWEGKKTSMSWMRMCPAMMEYDDETVGLTIFHELQHMTSVVTDHPTHAYEKKSMVELAKIDAPAARLNSDTYTMYIADTGMNRADFTKYTSTSGNNARSEHCYDSFSNCPEMSEGCCFDRTTGGGYRMD